MVTFRKCHRSSRQTLELARKIWADGGAVFAARSAGFLGDTKIRIPQFLGVGVVLDPQYGVLFCGV